MRSSKKRSSIQSLPSKKYRPYSEATLIKTIGEIKKIVPLYVRIERIVRDIPAQSIVRGGAKTSNLRQKLEEKMKKRAGIVNVSDVEK